MTLLGFLPFLKKASGADGEILSPPGFQFPVKELVASLNSFLKRLTTTAFFIMIYTKS